MDRGHLLSRTGSAAAEGSAAPSIASTPRHSTVHRLQDGTAVERARPSDAQLPGAGSGDGTVASLSAPAQPDLQTYVERKLASVNRVLNGGERISQPFRLCICASACHGSVINKPRPAAENLLVDRLVTLLCVSDWYVSAYISLAQIH